MPVDGYVEGKVRGRRKGAVGSRIFDVVDGNFNFHVFDDWVHAQRIRHVVEQGDVVSLGCCSRSAGICSDSEQNFVRKVAKLL
jgi:hypothetical protein